MNRPVFTAITRRAAILALGTVGLAALAPPHTTDARKKRRKRRSNRDANTLQLCKKQVGQCLDFFTPRCGDSTTCLDEFEVCCPVLGQCAFSGFFACLATTGAAASVVSPSLLP